MPRPRSRTIAGKPEPDIRLRLALRAGARYPAFKRLYRDDWLQVANLCCWLQSSKNLTECEFSRLAGRIFYAAAREYGFRRKYQPGNKKAPMAQMEVALYENTH